MKNMGVLQMLQHALELSKKMCRDTRPRVSPNIPMRSPDPPGGVSLQRKIRPDRFDPGDFSFKLTENTSLRGA